MLALYLLAITLLISSITATADLNSTRNYTDLTLLQEFLPLFNYSHSTNYAEFKGVWDSKDPIDPFSRSTGAATLSFRTWTITPSNHALLLPDALANGM